MSITELDSTVQSIRELQFMIEQLTSEAESLKDRIKAEMVNQGREELSGNGWRATWHAVTSARLDGKALRAADPSMYARFTKTTTVCRFCLY